MAVKAMDLFTNLDMHGGEVVNFVIEKLGTAPSHKEGRMYYNSTDDAVYISDGAAWKKLAVGDNLADYIKTSEKGTANGVATLDANTKIPFAQIPTGTGVGSVLTPATALSENQMLIVTANGIEGRTVAGVFDYAGSVETYANLPTAGTAGLDTGDVYIVKNAGIAGTNFPAGTAFVYNGTGWDRLGGTFDVSNCLKITDIVQALTGAETNKVPSVKAVKDAINTMQGDLSGSAIADFTDAPAVADAGKILITDSTGKVKTSTEMATQLAVIAENSDAINDLTTAVGKKADKKTPTYGEGVTADTEVGMVKVNGEGIVTSARKMVASDIPDISATYQTKANLVNELTGASNTTYPSTLAVKTALEDVTGTAKLTANKAVVTDADGHLSTAAVATTAAEVGHLAGVTAPIQTQINGKVAKNDDITPGTSPKVTYDAKGLVTGGEALSADDIPALPGEKITSGKVALAYLPTEVTGEHVLVAPVTTAADAGKVATLAADGKVSFVDRVKYFEDSLTFDGTAGDFTATVTHDLNTAGSGYLPQVTIYDGNGRVVYADVAVTETTATVGVMAATAPTGWKIVLVG